MREGWLFCFSCCIFCVFHVFHIVFCVFEGSSFVLDWFGVSQAWFLHFCFLCIFKCFWHKQLALQQQQVGSQLNVNLDGIICNVSVYTDIYFLLTWSWGDAHHNFGAAQVPTNWIGIDLRGTKSPLIGQAAHGRMAGIILLSAWPIRGDCYPHENGGKLTLTYLTIV